MIRQESQILGVSMRGWLAVMMTLTVCVMSGLDVQVKEPLYSAFLLALGFYYGQKTKQGEGNEKTTA